MKPKSRKWSIASKAVCSASAAALMFSLTPAAAFAAGPTAMKADNQIVAAAYAAANPAPEILGLDNPNQRSADEAEQTYNFFGDPAINSNPDPYLYNHHNGLTPGISIGGRQGSPMSALNNYDVDDDTAAQNGVWLTQPHIILGTGADQAPANESGYYDDQARVVEKALGLETNSYNPIGVTYNRTSLPTMIQTMYRLAQAADTVKQGNGKLTWRYEDPLEIAKDYERYIVGQKGLVKKAIDTNPSVSKKTIALVQSYDSSAKTYTIITDGVAEGTATTNRYLEAVQGVTDNYFNKVAESGKDTATVTAKQLADNVDVIIVGTAAGTDNTSPLTSALSSDGLIDKAYYCTNWANGSAFGTTVNSVENAQNIGRILPCVYPEVLDQSDMIAYYYDTFYHVTTGKTAQLIAERMDGVRNWDKKDSKSYTEWEVSDVAGYDHAKVEALLKEGVAYLNTQSGLGDYLTATGNVAGDQMVVDLKDVMVSVPAGILAGGAATPEPIVKYGSKVLAKGTDYTVAYENNTAVGQDGTLTITAVDGGNYTGSQTATFKIIEAENFNDSAVNAALSAESFTYSGQACEPDVTVTAGDATLTEGTDYVVTYADNIKVGEATATLSGIGNYSGTVEKKFNINKFKPVITLKTADNKDAYAVGDNFSISADAGLLFSGDKGSVKISVSPNDNSVIKTVTSGRNVSYELAGAGEATITASAAGTANCDAPESVSKTITVVKGTPKITVGAATEKDGKASISKTLGDATFNLNAKSTGDAVLSYASSDRSVVTVGNTGIVKVQGVGEATITVSQEETDGYNAATKEIAVTVNKKTQTIAAADVAKTVGDAAFDLGATTDGDGALTYASDNAKVATVDASGKVTVVGRGSAIITINAAETDEYAAATKTVTVAVGLKLQTITAADKTVAMGKTVALGAKASAGGALSYASSNAKVAKVAANGTVTPVAAGTADITITAAEKGDYAKATKTVKVKVTPGTQSIAFKKQSKKVKLKKVKKKKQVVTIAKATGAKTAVTYSIAKVNKSKKNFSINAATGKITVKKGTKKGKYSVTVKATAKKSANWNATTKNAVITIQVK